MLNQIYDIFSVLDYFLKTHLHKWGSGTESMNIFMAPNIMPNFLPNVLERLKMQSDMRESTRFFILLLARDII